MAKGSKKFVLVVLDGAADRPSKELQDRTPFEVAFKPNLDWFAENGKTGAHIPIKKGVAPESDSALMAILGYDPEKYFTGRGPLEAYGAGIPLKIGDLAVRANFATVKDGKLVDRRVGRTLTNTEAAMLTKSINKNVRLRFPFIFKHTIEHRGVLVVKGSFSDNVTNTDPGYTKMGRIAVAVKGKNVVTQSKALDDEEITQITANLLNNFTDQSYRVLKKHPLNISREANGLPPANILLLRDAGVELPDLPKKSGKWLAFSIMPLEIALAKLSGMQAIKYPHPEMSTANVYKNLYHNLRVYLDFVKKKLDEKWDEFDSFYIHIKETDIPGHDGMPVHKKKMLEMIDEILFSFLKKKNPKLLVTSDHATPSDLKRHSADLVPFLIYGSGKDKVKRFDEKSCAKGGFGKKYAKELMNLAQ